MLWKGVKVINLVLELLYKFFSSNAFVIFLWAIIILTFGYVIYLLTTNVVDFSVFHEGLYF